MRRHFVLGVGLVLAAAACGEDAGTPLQPSFSGNTGPDDGGPATYEVWVVNITESQPFTPPLAAVHQAGYTFWNVGAPASEGVQEIAENGNLGPMLAVVGAAPEVSDFAVTEGPTLPPLLPGEHVRFELEAEAGARYLSVISMLICTNDGFMGVTDYGLPRNVGDHDFWAVGSYDAGTEINTEDFGDLVPPCPPLTGVESDEPGTGMSNPALAENGVVHGHPGIRGGADLDPDHHGWQDPVAYIKVQRIR